MNSDFFIDLKTSVSNPTSWLFLGLNDIQSKYRRTKLGPWWIMIGMSITLGMMGVLWSFIFGLEWKHYLPYMMTGIVTWYWLSTYINGASELFTTEFTAMIRGLPVPPLTYVFRFISRGFLLHLHYIIIPISTLFLTGTVPDWSLIFWFPVSTILFLVNGFFVTIYLGFLCARLRDFSQLLTAVMAPLMMLTPVMWSPEMLGEYGYLADLNPFTHFLSIARDPLIGREVEMTSLLVVVCCTVINATIGLSVYNRYRKYLVFWL